MSEDSKKYMVEDIEGYRKVKQNTCTSYKMAPLENLVLIYEQEEQFINETYCHIPFKILDS